MSKLFSSNYKKIYKLFIIILILFNTINISNTTFTTVADETPELQIDTKNSIIPDHVYETIPAEFIISIINNGDTDATEDIRVEIKINDLLVATNSSSDDLPAQSSTFINLSWTPTYNDIGEYTLSVELYYGDNPNAIDYKDKPGFEVLEKPTELKIINIKLPDTYSVNKTAKILATVENNGENTTKPIYAKLNSSEDGEVETIIKNDPLHRGKSYVIYFNWTPSQFGSQKITIDIVYDGKTHDFKELLIIVGVDILKWWDHNWHYRHFVSVTGTGNVAGLFNFTGLLNDLGIVSQTFENNKFRIIEYNREGNISGIISKFKFIEGIGFDPVANAIGTLIWNVTGSSEEKYYFIYFDVENNLGNRPSLPETPQITESGDADIKYFGLTEGWCINILKPINASYSLVNEPIDILVSTKAKADYVKAYIFMTENESHNFTIFLGDIDDDTLWEYEDFMFDKEGNWTIRITSEDWVEYKPKAIQHIIYVGKPDIEALSITFTTNWPPTSPKIYKNDVVNITAHATAHNATVEYVDVSLSIFDINNAQVIHTDKTMMTIYKDEDNSVNFSWNANVSGKLKVTITLDPDNDILEQNESNNEIIEEITVNEWPDLEFNKIILPSEEVTEFEKVEIEVEVINKGKGNATNYEIALYIEPISQGFMTYTDKKASIFISINKNKSKTFSMYWDSAVPGEWYVGVKVLINNTKRDPFGKNRFVSNVTLKVKGIERKPPAIFNILTSPSYQEQGGPITITAEITDDTGIDYVNIEIKDPENKVYSGTMVRITGDEFRFIFYDTFLEGDYRFTIIAVDLTIYSNNATTRSFFTIHKDSIYPEILHYEANPYVQLINNDVDIICIATDNVGIDSVKTFIFPLGGNETEETLTWSPSGKYVYNNIYEIPGFYKFYIEVEDVAGRITSTDFKTFWITPDLDDIDNDGIPNWWEEKYGFNPEYKFDAGEDFDNDGLTNLEEFKAGTNPMKDIFVENAAFRIKDNALYLAASIVLFLFMLILSLFGKRRFLR